MMLVTAMTVLVKFQGTSYPAIQMVFIRATIGMIAIAPLIWRHRGQFRQMKQPLRNAGRVSCNAIALTGNFAALTLLPLALVNAIGFTRPLVSMLLAVLLLGEKVSRYRWVGAVIAFLGVLIMLSPSDIDWNMGLLAAFLSVIFGSLAAIQTRKLRDENTVVMMVFYTLGLTLLTAIPATVYWAPVRTQDWAPLLGIGILAQLGQYCFLRAYQLSEASVLAPFSYLSIVLATVAGFVFFGEFPGWKTIVGIVIILSVLQAIHHFEKNGRTSG